MVRKIHVGGRTIGLRGCGIQKPLIEAGKKLERKIEPSLPMEAIKRLESLRPKTTKRPNIKFSL